MNLAFGKGMKHTKAMVELEIKKSMKKFRLDVAFKSEKKADRNPGRFRMGKA